MVVAGLLGSWIWRWQPSRAPREGAPAEVEPAPGCAPQADTTCVDGDVWWVDGCGEVYAPAQDCGHRRCEAGACEEDSPGGCGEVTALGRCDGETARICQVGRVVEVDCASRGRRCVMTNEGPTCRSPTPDDCDTPGMTVCDRTVLRTCVDGRWSPFDCRAVGGICAPGRGGTAPQCLFAPPRIDDDCGPCGCPPEPSEEICDGIDNDGDGFVDENVECEPVDVVALVVVDGHESSYTDADIRDAIDELNSAFSRDDGYGLQFSLAEIVRVDEPAWLELDDAELDQALASGILGPDGGLAALRRASFYVPVLFTDTVIVEEVARPGLSTVPNGVCGGQRRLWGRQPPVGIVAVAKRRWPTTLAHEMGHFLGLCHTHEAPPPVRSVAARSDRTLAEAPACEDACADDPDGVCDTPLDPGPERCDVDDACQIHCETGDRPDPRNVMAYYPDCRSLFTVEQALLMRRSLALRRGWHPCVWGEGCPCTPERGNCPEGMTCRAYVRGDEVEPSWRCDLDGPALPGGICHDAGDCGAGSLCVHTPEGEARCARMCDPTTAACTCERITTPDVAVCNEDLEA